MRKISMVLSLCLFALCAGSSAAEPVASNAKEQVSDNRKSENGKPVTAEEKKLDKERRAEESQKRWKKLFSRKSDRWL